MPRSGRCSSTATITEQRDLRTSTARVKPSSTGAVHGRRPARRRRSDGRVLERARPARLETTRSSSGRSPCCPAFQASELPWAMQRHRRPWRARILGRLRLLEGGGHRGGRLPAVAQRPHERLGCGWPSPGGRPPRRARSRPSRASVNRSPARASTGSGLRRCQPPRCGRAPKELSGRQAKGRGADVTEEARSEAGSDHGRRDRVLRPSRVRGHEVAGRRGRRRDRLDRAVPLRPGVEATLPLRDHGRGGLADSESAGRIASCATTGRRRRPSSGHVIGRRAPDPPTR